MLLTVSCFSLQRRFSGVRPTRWSQYWVQGFLAQFLPQMIPPKIWIIITVAHFQQCTQGSALFDQVYLHNAHYCLLIYLFSTLGGGLKLFLPTFMRWATLARSCVLTVRRQYNLSPGLATNRWANSCWNMRMAHLKIGRWRSSLKTNGDDIWKN